MSKRDWRLLIEDMVESIDRIQTYTRGIAAEQFSHNQLIIDAVVRNLEIIGEAANHVPAAVRSRYPDIPWQNIIGLRHRVIHEYFGVDLSIVWHIVAYELEDLKVKLASTLLR